VHHLAEDRVLRVGNIQIAVEVDEDARRALQFSLVGGGAVAGVAPVAVAGHGRDQAAGRIDTADRIVVRIGDEEVAGRIHEDALGKVELRGRGRAAVTGVTPGAVPGNGRDCAGGGADLADHAVSSVRDVQVAPGIDEDGAGLVQAGLAGGGAIP